MLGRERRERAHRGPAAPARAMNSNGSVGARHERHADDRGGKSLRAADAEVVGRCARRARGTLGSRDELAASLPPRRTGRGRRVVVPTRWSRRAPDERHAFALEVLRARAPRGGERVLDVQVTTSSSSCTCVYVSDGRRAGASPMRAVELAGQHLVLQLLGERDPRADLDRRIRPHVRLDQAEPAFALARAAAARASAARAAPPAARPPARPPPPRAPRALGQQLGAGLRQLDAAAACGRAAARRSRARAAASGARARAG